MTTPTDDLAELLDGLDPDDMTPDQRIAAATLLAVNQLADVVTEERRGRRISQRLAVVAITVVLVVLTSFVVRWRIEEARYSRSTCTQRIERSEQIRAMGVALTAYATEVAGLHPSQAAEILEGAEQVALDTLPPPDC